LFSSLFLEHWAASIPGAAALVGGGVGIPPSGDRGPGKVLLVVPPLRD